MYLAVQWFYSVCPTVQWLDSGCPADVEKTNLLWTLKFWKYTFSGKKRVNYNKFEIATNCVNQIFNLNAFFFFLLTGATCYHLTINLVFTYLALFIDYKDDIFEVISNLHVQGSKFGGKIYKFGGKSKKKKVELHGVHGVRFFQVCVHDEGKVKIFSRLRRHKVRQP